MAKKKSPPQVERQNKDTRPNCPLCKNPMIAVSTSQYITHYQCKITKCPDKSLVQIPRPLAKPKRWSDVVAEHEAEVMADKPAIEDSGTAHPDVATGPFHGNANAKR